MSGAWKRALRVLKGGRWPVLKSAVIVAGLALVAAGLAVRLGGGGGGPEGTGPWSGVRYEGPGPPAAGPASPGASGRVARTLPVPEGAPAWVTIDSIGVSAPVGAYDVDAQRLPEVPLDAWEVAWYVFSAVPGQGSNAVFAGHVRWGGSPAVFANLEDVAVGDTIQVTAESGAPATYRVSEKLEFDQDDEDNFWVMDPTQADTVTLITCTGKWVREPDEQFGGHYTKRFIVRAVRVFPYSPWGF